MFNTLAQYFLGTSNNSNNLDPGAKTNHQEVPTNNNDHQKHVEQALNQQNAFQVYPNKRGRARRNRKNKVNNPAGPKATRNNQGGNCAADKQVVDDLAEDCVSPDFLLHGITTRICEDEDEWLFVECAQKANKKNGIISLHDDLLEADLTCLPDGGSPVYEPPKPRFEIKNNPLNLNQQQLKRQMRQQNAALISCEDIEDDEELMRATAASGGAVSVADSSEQTEEIQVIDPQQSAVVEGNSVDVEVPPVAIELSAVTEVHQQQQQAHGDEEPSKPHKAKTVTVSASAPVEIKQSKQRQNMEESWFVTPPSCFTSQGPVHMETSPMENLLIEHPSMSVYHGVRSMEQSADIGESLVVLEREVRMDQQQQDEEQETAPTSAPVTVAAAAGVERTPVHTNQVAFDEDDEEEEEDDEEDSDQDSDDDDQLDMTTPAVRSERPFNYVSNREEKQSLLFRTAQMNHDKKMRQKLCRNAMTRSNKTCEMNATKNGPKKRSEKQHAKQQSRANNNRKC